jgi:hypothetical protein
VGITDVTSAPTFFAGHGFALFQAIGLGYEHLPVLLLRHPEASKVRWPAVLRTRPGDPASGAAAASCAPVPPPAPPQVINGTEDSWSVFAQALVVNSPTVARAVLGHPAFNLTMVDWQLADFVLRESPYYDPHPDTRPYDGPGGIPYAETRDVVDEFFRRRVAAGHPRPTSVDDLLALLNRLKARETGAAEQAEQWGVPSVGDDDL